MITGKLDRLHKIKCIFCEKMLLILGLAICNTETIQVKIDYFLKKFDYVFK